MATPITATLKKVAFPPLIEKPFASQPIFHPDDLLPAWQLTLIKIAEVVIPIIVAVGLIIISNALLPTTYKAILLPLIGFGAVFTGAFMFIPKHLDVPSANMIRETGPLRPDHLNRPLPATSEVLCPEAPRGLKNLRNNCWINSLLQVLRADNSIMNWMVGMPEIIGRFSKSASFIPRELLYTAEEQERHPSSLVHMNESLPPYVLPTAEQNFSRKSYREKIDREILEWILQIPEFYYIPIAEIFSEKPVNELVPDEFFNRFPASERNARLERARKMIVHLREREDLIEAHCPPAFLNSLSEREQLIKSLTTYKTSLEVLKLIKPDMFLQIPLEQWNLDENPRIEASWLVPNEEIDFEATKAVLKELIQVTKQDPFIWDLFNENLHFMQTLTSVSFEDRQMILSYLTTLHNQGIPLKSIGFFVDFHNFFIQYEAAKRENQSLIALQADSQKMRAAFHSLRPTINESPVYEEDPSEALTVFELLLPGQLKVGETIERTYQIEGLPPLMAGQEPKTVNHEIRTPFFDLEIQGNHPVMSELWHLGRENHHPHINEREDGGTKFTSIDGVERNYPLLEAKTLLKTGPSSLWITLKRFSHPDSSSASDPSLIQRFLSFFSTKSSAKGSQSNDSRKLETAVTLTDPLTILTIDEGEVGYKLDAFIVHIGKSLHTGHFVSYKIEKNAAGQDVWFKLSDSFVDLADENELALMKEQAYICHYSRI